MDNDTDPEASLVPQDTQQGPQSRRVMLFDLPKRDSFSRTEALKDLASDPSDFTADTRHEVVTEIVTGCTVAYDQKCDGRSRRFWLSSGST